VDKTGKPDQILILGSASPELLKQSSESLSGRIVYENIIPFTQDEIKDTGFSVSRLWLQGGFPKSFLLDNDLSVK
jgi:uncharacterized protein